MASRPNFTLACYRALSCVALDPSQPNRYKNTEVGSAYETRDGDFFDARTPWGWGLTVPLIHTFTYGPRSRG
uniref:Uncharacterized protein n=1 Tax=Knipowitschia caucasica TaxID=637954 RepID=A0AAV2KMD4_KNICA